MAVLSILSGKPNRDEGQGLGGLLAQLVEQLTLNQRVVGSSPTQPTNFFNGLAINFVRPFFVRYHTGTTLH